MAWTSLGRDAVRKGDKNIEWLERETPAKTVSFKIAPEFHAEVEEYCKSNYIQLSSLLRYLLSKEIKANT